MPVYTVHDIKTALRMAIDTNSSKVNITFTPIEHIPSHDANSSIPQLHMDQLCLIRSILGHGESYNQQENDSDEEPTTLELIYSISGPINALTQCSTQSHRVFKASEQWNQW